MVLVGLAMAAAAATPLAIRVEVAALGKGSQATVVGVVIQVAPEDRQRAGERLHVTISRLVADKVVDSGEAVVEVQPDGTAMLYREWAPGDGEVRVWVESLSGSVRGGWAGKVTVTAAEKPFEAPPGSAPDAMALAPTSPASGVIHFKPPTRSGGIEAVEVELEAPEGTARVEFFQDNQLLFQRQRAPWTAAIPLGSVPKRTTVRAAAYAADGRFLGEDAIVLNGAANQLPIEILLGPEPVTGQGRRVTVSVGGAGKVAEVVLRGDDHPLVRWTECPCVTTLSAATLAGIKVLSADATSGDGLKGQAVKVLGVTGYQEAVRVEVVELPVTVLDRDGKLITGLPRDAFRVLEDGREVPLEGFGTTRELPLSLGILVDISGSMREVFPDVRSAVAGFASRLLREGDHYFLMTFAFEPRMTLDWTGDPRGLAEALERTVPEGGTALHDALVRALELFRGRRGRAALVLLSDGDDNSSRTPWDSALRYARTARVPIFTIGYGMSALDFFVRGHLKELAATTGAELFSAPKKKGSLEPVYARIDEELRAQYVLTYRSPSTKGPESFRTIRVEVKGEGLQARTIAGYYPSE